MVEYLLDTDHLSYVQEGHPKVVKKLTVLPPEDRVFTSVVSVAELGGRAGFGAWGCARNQR